MTRTPSQFAGVTISPYEQNVKVIQVSRERLSMALESWQLVTVLDGLILSDIQCTAAPLCRYICLNIKNKLF
ncbi:hypothetical protein [Enterobacter ludwigii]|uniref:hypothetical protein n=1 Tax=Enterobacter ludwigii TaxID=299767 RepID=UPI003F707823